MPPLGRGDGPWVMGRRAIAEVPGEVLGPSGQEVAFEEEVEQGEAIGLSSETVVEE